MVAAAVGARRQRGVKRHMPEVGGIAGEHLKGFIERIERLEEEKRALAEDIKEVYAEALGSGFDPEIMRQIIRIRRRDQDELDEEETLLDLYKRALGMMPAAAPRAAAEYRARPPRSTQSARSACAGRITAANARLRAAGPRGPTQTAGAVPDRLRPRRRASEANGNNRRVFVPPVGARFGRSKTPSIS